MRVALIDATNLFCMSYAVNKASAGGVPYGGAKGSIISLAGIIRDLKPQKVIAVWDGEKANSKKKEIFSEYKAGRKQKSVGRIFEFDSTDDQEKNKEWQMTIARRVIDMLPVCQIITNYYESDDAIGYITRHADYFGHTGTIIVSCDKDFFQLASKNCMIYNRMTKQPITHDSILKDYNIHPNNWLAAKAMVGDNSDNLNGIKGIGFKTIAKLFDLKREEAYTLEEIKQVSKEKETETKYKAILENFDVIERNYQLMDLKNPLISATDKQRITDKINNFSPTLDRKDFYVYLMKLGERGIGLDPSIIESFNGLEKR